MSITLQVFEESGAPTAGRGVVTEIDNINWKNSSAVAYAYYSYPLRRPLFPQNQTLSFKKYVFFKISGVYGKIKNFKINMELNEPKQANNTQLFYKFSNVYQEPNNLYDGSMIYTNNEPIVWYPNMSNVSPLNATSRPVLLENQIVYTNYLVTQMRVNASEWNDVGNTDEFVFTFSLNEFE